MGVAALTVAARKQGNLSAFIEKYGKMKSTIPVCE